AGVAVGDEAAPAARAARQVVAAEGEVGGVPEKAPSAPRARRDRDAAEFALPVLAEVVARQAGGHLLVEVVPLVDRLAGQRVDDGQRFLLVRRLRIVGRVETVP